MGAVIVVVVVVHAWLAVQAVGCFSQAIFIHSEQDCVRGTM
jgi:hypothetical protein